MFERHLACLSPSGFHRVVYDERSGPAGAPTLVCVHGLTRNGRDFDALAGAMARTHRVVCPEMAGRGRSEWLKNPAEYVFPTYLADSAALIARLDVDGVDWVGTSMGALIGMMLAAQKDSPIRRLVLNDAGAFVMKEGLERIGAYVGSGETFASIEDMEAAVRRNNVAFGPLTDAQWRKLTLDSARQLPDGRFGYNYDPRIGDIARAAPVADVNLWAVYDAVRCPTLILRGETSDVLSREVAVEMTERGPRATLVEFAGVGHAPQLLSEDQIGAVRDFLTL
jgi:pimeloyl-ACP methyl ester carboxylesterase